MSSAVITTDNRQTAIGGKEDSPNLPVFENAVDRPAPFASAMNVRYAAILCGFLLSFESRTFPQSCATTGILSFLRFGLGPERGLLGVWVEWTIDEGGIAKAEAAANVELVRVSVRLERACRRSER
jgi:hypothetical protein